MSSINWYKLKQFKFLKFPCLYVNQKRNVFFPLNINILLEIIVYRAKEKGTLFLSVFTFVLVFHLGLQYPGTDRLRETKVTGWARSEQTQELGGCRVVTQSYSSSHPKWGQACTDACKSASVSLPTQLPTSLHIWWALKTFKHCPRLRRHG